MILMLATANENHLGAGGHDFIAAETWRLWSGHSTKLGCPVEINPTAYRKIDP